VVAFDRGDVMAAAIATSLALTETLPPTTSKNSSIERDFSAAGVKPPEEFSIAPSDRVGVGHARSQFLDSWRCSTGFATGSPSHETEIRASPHMEAMAASAARLHPSRDRR